MLFILIPLCSLLLYILRLVSGFEDSNGTIYISYNISYPFILLGEYAIINIFLLFCAKKIEKKEEPDIYVLSLMLLAALGMMKIDSDTPITSTNADHSPSFMFIILFATLIITAFSGHSFLGCIGTIAGAALFPAFGLCFAPFIFASAFILTKEKKKEHRISLILNGLAALGAFIYGAVKLGITEIAFDKKYVPVILLVLAWAVLCICKKEYTLLPLSMLPLFPLTAGMIFGAFPTPLFTLSAGVAPFVILLGTAALKGTNKTITGYAKDFSHNPVIYIIVTAFVVHTAGIMFVLPGFIRDVYI